MLSFRLVEKKDLSVLKQWALPEQDLLSLSFETSKSARDQIGLWVFNNLVAGSPRQLLAVENEKNEFLGLLSLYNIDWRNAFASLEIYFHSQQAAPKEVSELFNRFALYLFESLQLRNILILVQDSKRELVETFQKMGLKEAVRLKEQLYRNHQYEDLIIFQLKRDGNTI